MLGLITDWLDRRRALRGLRSGQKEFSQDWYPVFKLDIERAATLRDQGERELAREILAKARARFPDVALFTDSYLNLLIDVGCYDEAEALIGEGRRRYPHEAPLALCHVRVAERRGDREEAVRRCESMRSKFPRVAEFYTTAAACLNELGRSQEAEALYERGARKLPDDFEMNVHLARLAERRKDWSEAMRRWELVRERFDKFHGPTGVANCLWEMGRRDEAEALLAETAKRFTNDPWPLVDLARFATEAGDLHEATKRWGDVRKWFPSFELGYTRAAEVARRAGNEEEADKLLAAGIDRCRWDLAVHLEYARNAHRQKDWVAAIDRWALVLSKFPDCDEARKGEAEARAALDQQPRHGDQEAVQSA